MEIKENTVYNMDCLELMREMEREGFKVDCIITDPPYLINYKTNYRKDKNNKFCNTILNDNNEQLIIEYIKLCNNILKDNSAIYMFCNSNKIDIFKQEIEKYFNIKNIIVWVKNNWSAGDLDAQFGKQYEFIIYANKGRRCFNEDKKRLTDVWFENRIVGNNQIHQNQKPENLISKIINISSNKNDLIFDGFMGSFTTAVCCRKTDRRFIGAELDKEYFEKGMERLKKEQSQVNIFDILNKK